MPRRVRELEDNAIYHIFARGNNRQKIFQDKEDYPVYRAILQEAKARYSFQIYHYCLMTNHVHLLLRVAEGAGLPKLMHWIQLGYARYHQKKYRYCGHLFQGRFRSPRIPEESYYLQCGRYIERNPVKAGMVTEAAEYAWSSAPYYVRGVEDGLLTPNLYYEAMGKTASERREAYRRFVAIEEPYRAMLDESLMKT